MPDTLPNKLKHWSLEERKVYYRATQRDEVAHALKSPGFPKGFCKVFLKARWGEGVVAEFVISLSTILCLADGEVTGVHSIGP